MLGSLMQVSLMKDAWVCCIGISPIQLVFFLCFFGVVVPSLLGAHDWPDEGCQPSWDTSFLVMMQFVLRPFPSLY